jgi:hypothetical protein
MSYSWAILGDIYLDGYSGGVDKGRCLQLSIRNGASYVGLTIPEVAQLVRSLALWLGEMERQKRDV